MTDIYRDGGLVKIHAKVQPGRFFMLVKGASVNGFEK
jgi:hypothetical protein